MYDDDDGDDGDYVDDDGWTRPNYCFCSSKPSPVIIIGLDPLKGFSNFAFKATKPLLFCKVLPYQLKYT